jgi:hypothetical protein
MKYTNKQIRLAYKNGVLETLKNNMIEAEIAKRYSVGNQIAILRQKDSKPEEYEEFNSFTENCKDTVKAYLAGILGVEVTELNRLMLE